MPYDVKSCDHRRSFFNAGKTATITSTGYSGSYTFIMTFTGNLPGFVELLAGASVYDSNMTTLVNALPLQGGEGRNRYINWDNLLTAYMEKSQSVVRAEMLLGETVAQPQLVVDAIRFLANPALGMTRLVKYVAKRYGKQARRRTTGDIARRVLKDAANSTLMYNFAIKPLVSDILGIKNATRIVQERVRYLSKHQGNFVPVKVRTISSPDEYTCDFHPPGAVLFKTAPVDELSACLGAWFRVRRDIALEANVNAYVQYFGIGKVLNLVWELVPWSFVVDWVTNTQERINRISQVHTYNPFSESRGFTASVRVDRTESIRISSGFIFVYGVTIPEYLSGTELGSRRYTRYTRFLNFPESRSLFDSSNLGVQHIINGGSLLIQQLLKNR